MVRFQYETCCVHATGEDIDAMTIRARNIGFDTFARHCDWREWADQQGYERSRKGLKLKNDLHVRLEGDRDDRRVDRHLTRRTCHGKIQR